MSNTITIDGIEYPVVTDMAGTPVITTTTSTDLVDQLNNVFTTNSLGLSKEEAAEREELLAEHAQQVKTAKLNIFKSLPAPLRQYVINSILWTDAVRNMDSMSLPESHRLKELNSRNFPYNSRLAGHNSTWQSVRDDRYLITPPMPADITEEELQQAHLEATLEESMLEKNNASE
jgi:hypothetical protein